MLDCISIHAPREGSDCLLKILDGLRDNFYPRSPRGERRPHRLRVRATPGHFYPRSPRGERPNILNMLSAGSAFLSTLPARGATSQCVQSRRHGTFLSTLPARGATISLQQPSGHLPISIHAPREGSDRHRPRPGLVKEISIHAPREGSDWEAKSASAALGHFYPRSPRGERRSEQADSITTAEFLSTLPARGATARRVYLAQLKAFLSTLPARGAT